MPLSVMLNGYFAELHKGMRAVAPWQSLTERFELVLSRLRSAYLVRWFGSPIPTTGVTMKVAIVNSDELRARWLAVGGNTDKRARPPTANLLEPLLGTTGLLAGSLALPFNSLLLSPLLYSTVDSVLAKALAVVSWFTFGGLFTLLLPVAALGVLGLPILANSPIARSVFDLLGALAELATPFAEFWRQVSGPRDAVRNSLLRLVLDLADALAAAAIQLLGFAAEAVARLAPMVPSTIAGLKATAGAAVVMIGMIQVAVLSTVTGLTLWWKGPGSPLAVLHAVVAFVPRLFRSLSRIVRDAGNSLIGKLAPNLARAGLALGLWIASIRPFIASQTTDHPTVLWLRSLATSVGAFRAWRARTAPPAAPPPPPSPPSSPGMVGRAARAFANELLRRSGMPPSAPTFTPPAPIASFFEMRDPATIRAFAASTPNPFGLTAGELGALRRWRRPPSIFGAEWRDVERRRNDPSSITRAMGAASLLTQLEPILTHRAGQSAGPAMAELVPQLEDVLGRLDASLRPSSRRQPTRLLDEPTEIRPVIGRLRVHADDPDTERPRYEAFVTALRSKLDAPYPVPAAPVLAGAGATRRR